MFSKIIKASMVTGGFLVFSALPVLATESDCDHPDPVSQTQKTTVMQVNETEVSNEVAVMQNTGGNQIKGVVFGTADIDTGDNDATVKIQNQAGGNTAHVDPCNTCEPEMEYHSYKPPTAPSNHTMVMQVNKTQFANGVAVAQNTGLNKIYGGYKSTSSVTTGHNTAKVKIKNMAGFNQISLP